MEHRVTEDGRVPLLYLPRKEKPAAYLPTGNEYVSLPRINETTGEIEDLTFLSMQFKGLIDIRGNRETPLIRPFLQINGEETPLEDLSWTREHAWIPVLRAKAGAYRFSMTVLAPIEERGFAVKCSLEGPSDAAVTWGLCGCWDSSWHCVNEDKELEGSVHCYESDWNCSLIFDFRSGAPVFAFAPMCETLLQAEHRKEENRIHYRLFKNDTLRAGESCELIIAWGLGFEEVSAAASAQEILRQGWDWMYQKTADWLDARASSMPTPKLTALYQTNLFFCLFYSTGLTLDTEELVCVTSRSTRYYVSAAYWDRDTLLWAYPAILDADPETAGKILEYIFHRQRKNLGIHSCYIDGTVLEPGFELDELMSPVIALQKYMEKTGDRSLLEEPDVRKALRQILKTLASMRHPEIALYKTYLQTSDDQVLYPYLTYNNVLVWYALRALAAMLPEQYSRLSGEAENVRNAIFAHCAVPDREGNLYYAWSVDLQGHHQLYDEPTGSLQLLPYYGFCDESDEIWQNTVRKIRSPEYEYSFCDAPIAEIGCAHAPYPWVLSICNSLICGYREQAFRELEQIQMDNGIACESVDPDTGDCATGAAFATCAGFLCHAMKEAAAMN